MSENTQFTLFQQTTYQTVACVGKVIDLIALTERERPATPSQQTIDQMLSKLKTLCLHMRLLMVIANVDNIQYVIWRQHPDRPCKDVQGRVRKDIREHPIDKLD
ncbi:hypothetical protein FBEOM_2051 [Fusarium beomiforme]|uniref:Uncharacterized protein n=1 Tax=Fusarium beomiforme TaxID=44412 RepID=A0A9P5E0C7_9HYPO|nr:hypothetical protein FBEOM_2051 [Fusarium beomiforme]